MIINVFYLIFFGYEDSHVYQMYNKQKMKKSLKVFVYEIFEFRLIIILKRELNRVQYTLS